MRPQGTGREEVYMNMRQYQWHSDHWPEAQGQSCHQQRWLIHQDGTIGCLPHSAQVSAPRPTPILPAHPDRFLALLPAVDEPAQRQATRFAYQFAQSLAQMSPIEQVIIF